MTYELIYEFNNIVSVPITKMCGGIKLNKKITKKITKKRTKKITKRGKTYKKKKRKTS